MPARQPHSNLMALAATSGEGASSPKLWGPRREIIPVGRRRRETAKIPVQCRKAMASPQAGWLHPALGCQLHHPWAARAGRWSPSSKHYFPVSQNLCGMRGGGGKQRKPSGKYTKELCCSKTYRKDFPIDKLLSAFPV